MALAGKGNNPMYTILFKSSTQKTPTNSQAFPIEGLRYVACAAAWTHTVLLRDDGEVLAIGGNGRGQFLDYLSDGWVPTHLSCKSV